MSECYVGSTRDFLKLLPFAWYDYEPAGSDLAEWSF